MSESLDKAVATQLANIQAKSGKTLDELSAMIAESGLTKHGEIRTMLQSELGLSYGDANALVHYALQSDGQRAAEAKGLQPDEVLDEIYSGKKADLRPIHDRLMAEIDRFGPFEVVPKKGYVSLRRKKQFAMIGPATNARVDLGINAKGMESSERLLVMPAGGMCNYTVRVTDATQVNDELVGWIREAYEGAG